MEAKLTGMLAIYWEHIRRIGPGMVDELKVWMHKKLMYMKQNEI